MKNHNIRLFATAYLVIIVSVLALPKVLSVFSPTFENVEIAHGNEFVPTRLPYKKKSRRSKVYEFRATFDLHSLNKKKVRIVPDDCIKSIRVNDKDVDLSHVNKKKRCDRRYGLILDIARYARDGKNNIIVQIQDKGGSVGLELRPVIGSEFYIVNGLAIALFLALLYLASRNFGVRYSVLLLPVVVAYGYTVMRFQMNVEYSGATWDQLYDLTAPRPFGHRILVPLMSRPLVRFWGMPVKSAFVFYEFCFSLLTIAILNRLFGVYLNRKIAYFLSVLFILFLTLPYLLRYQWPVYYPYDTASVFFMITGLYFTVRKNWPLLIAVMALGALNRETIVLLIPLFLLLTADQLTLKKQMAVAVALTTAFICTRLVISLVLNTNGAEAVHFFVGKRLRVLNNIDWIMKGPLDNLVQFLASVAFVPLLWWVSRRYMPHGLRRLEVWAVLFFAPLFVAGNIYEPRIFGEIIAVLYVPIMLGAIRQSGGKVNDLFVAPDNEFQWVESPKLNRIFGKLVRCFDKYGLAATCVISVISILFFIHLNS